MSNSKFISSLIQERIKKSEQNLKKIESEAQNTKTDNPIDKIKKKLEKEKQDKLEKEKQERFEQEKQKKQEKQEKQQKQYKPIQLYKSTSDYLIQINNVLSQYQQFIQQQYEQIDANIYKYRQIFVQLCKIYFQCSNDDDKIKIVMNIVISITQMKQIFYQKWMFIKDSYYLNQILQIFDQIHTKETSQLKQQIIQHELKYIYQNQQNNDQELYDFANCASKAISTVFSVASIFIPGLAPVSMALNVVNEVGNYVYEQQKNKQQNQPEFQQLYFSE